MNANSTARKHDRAPLDLYINKIVGDEPHMMRTRDISAGGVYVYKLLEPNLSEVDQVGLEMKLPNSDEVIWAVGKVVREESSSNTDGVAISFVRIADADRKLIEAYVASAKDAAVRAA